MQNLWQDRGDGLCQLAGFWQALAAWLCRQNDHGDFEKGIAHFRCGDPVRFKQNLLFATQLHIDGAGNALNGVDDVLQAGCAVQGFHGAFARQ